MNEVDREMLFFLYLAGAVALLIAPPAGVVFLMARAGCGPEVSVAVSVPVFFGTLWILRRTRIWP